MAYFSSQMRIKDLPFVHGPLRYLQTYNLLTKHFDKTFETCEDYEALNIYFLGCQNVVTVYFCLPCGLL